MIRFEMAPDRGGVIEFNDIAQALVWVQDEISGWSKAVTGVGGKLDSPFASPWQAWSRIQEDLQTIRSRLRSHNQSADYDAPYGDIVIRQSAVAKALLATAKNVGVLGADAAASRLGLTESQIRWSEQATIAGLMAYDLYYKIYHDNQDDKAVEKQEKSLKSITDRIELLSEKLVEFQKTLSVVEEAFNTQSTSAAEFLQSVQATTSAGLNEIASDAEKSADKARLEVKELSSAIKKHEEDVKKFKTSYLDEIKKNLSEADKKISAWVSAQMEQTRLEAPVKLWESRSSEHKMRAVTLQRISLAFAIIGIAITIGVCIGSFALAEWLFKNASVRIGDDRIVTDHLRNLIATASSGDILRPTFHFEIVFAGAGTLLWLTLFIWAMRVLVRQYTTEDHLAIDASARAAMTQTYLGLIKEGGASDHERAIVLAAIFRPVTERATSDDGPPAMSLPALAAAIVSGKSPT